MQNVLNPDSSIGETTNMARQPGTLFPLLKNGGVLLVAVLPILVAACVVVGLIPLIPMAGLTALFP